MPGTLRNREKENEEKSGNSWPARRPSADLGIIHTHAGCSFSCSRRSDGAVVVAVATEAGQCA